MISLFVCAQILPNRVAKSTGFIQLKENLGEYVIINEDNFPEPDSIDDLIEDLETIGCDTIISYTSRARALGGLLQLFHL